MKVKISVTEEHITTAERAVLEKSPVSLALSEKFGGEWSAYRSFVSSPGFGRYAYVSAKLPKSARIWLEKFDYGEGISPFTFMLDLPSGLEGRFVAI